MAQATPETDWVEERLQNFMWLLFLQKHSLNRLLHLVSLVFHHSLTGLHVSNDLFFKKKHTPFCTYIYTCMHAYVFIRTFLNCTFMN